jgi:hypothetical protein
MQNDQDQPLLWKAGDIVPAGSYRRVDDTLHRLVVLQQKGPLPASFDGHVALYRASVPAKELLEHLHQQQTPSPTLSEVQRLDHAG